MLLSLTAGCLLLHFSSVEIPGAEPAAVSGQLMEFLVILLAVAGIAIAAVIAVVLYRSWRRNRLKAPMKEYIYKRKQ